MSKAKSKKRITKKQLEKLLHLLAPELRELLKRST